jgi:hypothetical protein
MVPEGAKRARSSVMREQAKWVEWLHRLHQVTGELARKGASASYDAPTLVAWADELRAVSEDMRRESNRGPNDPN